MILSALHNNIYNIHVMCTGLSWIGGFITTGIELIGKISMKNYISSRRDTRFLESNMIHDF